MSAAPRYPDNLGYAGLCMTADEYLAPERYQLVRGVVVMSPSPFADRNRILAQIVYQLEAFTAQGGSICVMPETDVRFGPDTVYQPDISVYRMERLPPKFKRLDSPPDLVIEILSRGTKLLDLNTRRLDYERFGVPEYWTIDPENGEVRCWRRQGAQLVKVPVEGDLLASSAIDGFTLQLAPVRARASGGQ